MNKIGSLGNVVFEVSHEKVRTFEELTRTSTPRWATHEVIGKRPLLQFIGPGLDTSSLTIRFDVRFGVNPRKEIAQLVEYERLGKALPFLLGGKPVGKGGMWVITGLEQEWTSIDNRGNLLAATVNLSLEEYAK